MPDLIERKGWLYTTGDWSTHPEPSIARVGVVDRARLERIAANTAAFGACPLDIEHADTDEVFDYGRVDTGRLAVQYGHPPGAPEREGWWLTGPVLTYPGDDARYKARGLSVYLLPAADRLAKLTVTRAPRVAGAAFSDGSGNPPAAEAAVAFSGGVIVGDTPNTNPEAGAQVAAEGLTEEKVESLFSRVLGRLLPRHVAGTPETTPDEPAAFSEARVKAILEECVAPVVQRMESDQAHYEAAIGELRSKLDETYRTTAMYADTVTDLTTRDLEARIAADVDAGVPPAFARAARLLQAGATAAETVAKFAEGETERSVSLAEFVDEAIGFAAGTVKTSPVLPTRDDDNAAVGDADVRAAKLAAAKFAQARDAGQPITLAAAQFAADRELGLYGAEADGPDEEV